MNTKETVELNQVTIRGLLTDSGGLTNEVVKGLTGIYPHQGLREGWLKRLCGTRIDKEKYDYLVSVRNKTAKEMRREQKSKGHRGTPDMFGDFAPPVSMESPKQNAVEPTPWEPDYDAEFPIDGAPVATSPAQPADTGLVILTLDGKEIARLKPGRYELRKV